MAVLLHPPTSVVHMILLHPPTASVVHVVLLHPPDSNFILLVSSVIIEADAVNHPGIEIIAGICWNH